MHKVAFVDLSENFWDKHPVYSLSAYLKKNGVVVNYVKGKRFETVLKKIKALQPDLLMYSSFNVHIPVYVEFDKFVKKHIKIKSIMGGPGPTYEWGLSKNCAIDAFCVGEGEYALLEYILSDYSGGRNIILNGEEAPRGYFQLAILDELPFPDRDLVYYEDNLIKELSTRWFLSGRGCPYQCTYCFNHKFNEMFASCGPVIRKKSVDYLLEEISAVKKKYPINNIVFQDDTFIINKEWFFEFCERYARTLRLPYTCNIRPNLVSLDIVKALKDSGCVAVMWSIESGNDHLRNDILKRNVSKNEIIKTDKLLDDFNIPYRVGNMIGLPGESFEQILETLRLNIDIKPTLANATIYVPYPNLKLTHYAMKNNYLSREALRNLPKNLFTQSVLNITLEENRRVQKLAYLFPILVNWPFLFTHPWTFNFMLSLPKCILLAMYEGFNLFMQMKVYHAKPSFSVTARMIIRYLYNRQMS